MRPSRRVTEPPSLALAEEALDLLRQCGLVTLSTYYIGAMPFVLALLFFWSALAHLPNVHDHVGLAALALALLFVWMKVWQARFCRLLLAQVQQTTPEKWGVGAFVNACASQGALQATGWIIIPIALLCLAPVPMVYGFYQHCTVLEDGRYQRLRDLAREGMALAVLWPRQQVLVLWLLSPLLLYVACALYYGVMPVMDALELPLIGMAFAVYSTIAFIVLAPFCPLPLVVALNIGIGIYMAGTLLGSLLGIQNLFTYAPQAATNVSFMASVCGLAYLVLDPAVKSAYVLRHFYGSARRTGEDLLLGLSAPETKRAALTLCVMAALLMGVPAVGQENPRVGPDQVDAALERELAEPQYSWRDPNVLEYESGNLIVRAAESLAESLRSIVEKVGEWIDKFVDWLIGEDDEAPQGGGGLSAITMQDMLRVLLLVLCAALVGVLLVFLLRLWRHKERHRPEALVAASATVPDVEDERTTADKLPEEGWLALARDYRARGEFRLAMRCVFLACLARLAHQGTIQIAHAKTNLDYFRELQRRAHAQPHLPPAFSQGVSLYERVWYGDHPADDAGVAQLTSIEESMVLRAQE